MNTISQIPVANIMQERVVTIDEKQPIGAAKEFMVRHNVRHIPVVNDHGLVGILSKVDIDKWQHISSNDLPETSILVEKIMTTSVHTLQQDETIKDAAEMLTLGWYHALPVLKDDKLVGIITSTDLILYMLKYFGKTDHNPIPIE